MVEKKVGKKSTKKVDSILSLKKPKKKRVSKIKKREEKQLRWVLGGVLLIFILVFGMYLYMSNVKKFEYVGIPFVRKQFEGGGVMYHGKFPFIYNGEHLFNYNLYLRTDPRKNKIPVSADIELARRKNIIISIDPESAVCDKAIIGQVTMVQFFEVLPWIDNIVVGTNDREAAEKTDLNYFDCDSASSRNLVLMIQKSETPEVIYGENENCVLVNVGQCENIKTAERVVMKTLAEINNMEL